MRIIAGERRGHHIEGPSHRKLRPTSDNVREAIFNIVREDVADSMVLDLFAGTGALGLEALSRGASRALFVERDRSSAAIIRNNLALLRYEDRGQVATADAYRVAQTYQPLDARPILVFVDPPYGDYETQARKLRAMLDHLIQGLPDESVLLVESGKPLDARFLDEPSVWDQRRYGSTAIAIRRIERSAGQAVLHDDAPAAHPVEPHEGGDG